MNNTFKAIEIPYVNVCSLKPERVEDLEFAILTLEEIKQIVDKWKADTWTDGLSYECMAEISKLFEETEE